MCLTINNLLYLISINFLACFCDNFFVIKNLSLPIFFENSKLYQKSVVIKRILKNKQFL